MDWKLFNCLKKKANSAIISDKTNSTMGVEMCFYIYQRSCHLEKLLMKKQPLFLTSYQAAMVEKNNTFFLVSCF